MILPVAMGRRMSANLLTPPHGQLSGEGFPPEPFPTCVDAPSALGPEGPGPLRHRLPEPTPPGEPPLLRRALRSQWGQNPVSPLRGGVTSP